MYFMLNEKIDQRYDGNKEPMHEFNRIRYKRSISREKHLRSGDGNPLYARNVVSPPMEMAGTNLFLFTVPSDVHAMAPSIQGRLHIM